MLTDIKNQAGVQVERGSNPPSASKLRRNSK